MDELEADDIRRARETPPSEKLRQVAELSAFAMHVMWRNLRRRHPEATDEEIEALFQTWLLEEP